MASGEHSPWGQGPAEPAVDPYRGSYQGPWGPGPGEASGWGAPSPWPSNVPGPLTDQQLSRLPPPVPAAPWSPPRPVGEQRPAVVGLAVTLAVTSSLLWVCAVSLFGLVALAGTQELAGAGDDGMVFHTLDEFVLRMGDGLWVPLYGFPVASIVTAFMLLNRRPWARVAHSAVGAASLAWAGWWLRDSLLTWFVVAVYVGLAVAVLWTPAVGRWYATRPERSRPSGYPLDG